MLPGLSSYQFKLVILDSVLLSGDDLIVGFRVAAELAQLERLQGLFLF